MRLRDQLRIEVTPDGMVASLVPLARYSDANAQGVAGLLTQHGIRYGVLEEQIEEFLVRWQRGSVGHPWVVARGVPAVAPESRGLRRIHPPARSGRDAVELLPLYVKKGEALFEVTSGLSGRRGRDVYGEFHEPVAAAGGQLEPGPGIRVDDDVWFAAGTGFLTKEEHRVDVVDTMLQKRDLPQGEYSWDGDAFVHGSVLDGTQLRVTGNLTIRGEVQANCILQVGGDLLLDCAQGGRTARMEVVGDVTARELHDVQVLAGGNITVTGSSMQSNLRTRGQFVCTGDGTVVQGGHIDAVSGAEISEVGDSKGTVTHITVGRARWVADQIRSLDAEIRGWVGYNARVVEAFEDRWGELLEDRSKIYRLPDAERIRFEEARLDALHDQERVDRRIGEIRALKQRLVESHSIDSRAVIRVELAWRNTELTVRNQTHTVKKRQVENVVFCISPSTRRILPIPHAIFDSADPDSLFTGESEYFRISR